MSNQAAMKIVVTGATGLIGRHLCQSLLNDGHTVIGLSRSPEKAQDVSVTEMRQWDTMSGPPAADILNGADAVVHLAGAPIAEHRWSDEQKKRVRDSRIISTHNLVNGLRAMTEKPATFISGSAIGFYGDRGDEPLDEQSPAGTGFMADVCKMWEQEAEPAAALGIRTALVRTGVVLSREGGALEKMKTPFNLGLGGKLGDGKQWFPWIHLDDIIGCFRYVLANEMMKGPVNGTAPNPVTNAEFTDRLAHAMRRPSFLWVPELGLRAVMGEMADMLLSSQRVLPRALLAAGYRFRFEHLADALADLLD